jgi:hypothetical protein
MLKVPIKRAAGQSGEERLKAIVDEQLLPGIVSSIFLICFAGFEWIKYFLRLPPQPLGVTVAAVASIAIIIYRYRRLSPLIKQMRLGVDGEKEVGQLLSEINDYSVVHDIQFDDFNIDHALIGESGVYCVETKTRSKNVGEKVAYDGHSILVNGHSPDRDPLEQVQANSRSLRKLILELTGLEVPVQPVVLFPSWWVESKVKNPTVWVLNPGQLQHHLRKKTSRFNKEQIQIIYAALKRSQGVKPTSGSAS